MLVDDVEQAPRARSRSIQSVVSLSTPGSRESRRVRLRWYAAAHRSPRAGQLPV